MTTQNADAVGLEIIKCVKVLKKSERGRDIAAALHAFLNGRVAGLDGMGWSAVVCLLEKFQDGYQGSVLDSLSEFVL